MLGQSSPFRAMAQGQRSWSTSQRPVLHQTLTPSSNSKIQRLVHHRVNLGVMSKYKSSEPETANQTCIGFSAIHCWGRENSSSWSCVKLKTQRTVQHWNAAGFNFVKQIRLSTVWWLQNYNEMARWPFWHYPFDSACEAWIQHVTHDVIQMLHIDPLWYVGGKRSQLKIYTMVTVPFVPLALSAVWPFAADGFLPLVTMIDIQLCRKS